MAPDSNKAHDDSEGPGAPGKHAHKAATQQQVASWTRYSTIGFQFTGGIAMFAYAGYWLEQKFDWDPWGLITGLFVGFAVSLTWLYYKSFPSDR